MHKEKDDAATVVGTDVSVTDTPTQNGTGNVTDEQLLQALQDSACRERVLFGSEELMNAVIERYLEELSGAVSVPVVRGYSALSPVRKPRTLQEAKEIVDGK